MNINEIKGVGEKSAKALSTICVKTVYDILNYFPREYEFRGECKAVKDMINGEMASFIGEVYKVYPYKKFSRNKGYAKIVFKSDNDYVTGVWFNQPYIYKTLQIGEKVFLYGKVEIFNGHVEMKDIQHHKLDGKSLKEIYPIYALNKSLTQNALRKVVQEALKFKTSEIIEFMPNKILKEYDLMDLDEAIENIHFPKNKDMLNKALKRLKFNELFILNLAILMVHNEFSNEEVGISVGISKELVDLKNSLPFSLTNAQSKVVREVLNDMKGNNPMNRLVQGDVGSGKTMVAIIAMFNVVKMGYQAAMMAPTEILANQHFESITKTLEGFNVNIRLITGSTTKKQKNIILEEVQKGEIDILIGTHAIIEDNVEFKNLALVITDEQHRFGVRQRAKLVNKGKNPHVLVMTATPIPRTLAIFMYGDMDISIIDELPPGRQEIKTYYINSLKREASFGFIKKEIDKGRQCYIVCPLVEESEKLNLKSATEMVEELRNTHFKNYSLGLLHGKMKSKEKDSIMNEFKNGNIDVLVSTTVIEVGVNVPNASVMYIENAERFGLAQLHQLRGRVGRGEYSSHCILYSDAKNKESLERLKIMSSTTDGFVIAEKDMEIRGFGEFFGIRQHGIFQFKVADIFRDINLLKLTREIAKNTIENEKDNIEYANLFGEVNKKYLEEANMESFN